MPPVLEWGELRFNLSNHKVSYGEIPIDLTPKEYALLRLFLYNRHRTFTRSEILDRLWTLDVKSWVNMNVFEYDENKSQSNLIKHGIDFVEAQKLWDDPNRLEISARTQDEPRSLVLGKHWSAITTDRPPNIRIISVRRSRTEEINLYESSRI